jgi:hypothetical protein
VKPRAIGVIFADQIKLGDIIFASYHIPPRGDELSGGETQRGTSPEGDLVCAWVQVDEIKYHTDTTVTMFSHPVDHPRYLGVSGLHRWVEYPRDAPLVLGIL